MVLWQFHEKPCHARPRMAPSWQYSIRSIVGMWVGNGIRASQQTHLSRAIRIASGVCRHFRIYYCVIASHRGSSCCVVECDWFAFPQ